MPDEEKGTTMNGYLLSEGEIKQLEDNPALITERLKVWRSTVEERKNQAARTQEFILQQADKTGET